MEHSIHQSLSEVHSSVDTDSKKGFWKKLLSFLGPAYLISVGYMDPGNWATDIAGGSKFGYALLWVLLMSNLIALLLQSLSARLGLVRGRDLAQASRETFSRPVNFCLYILAEIAIAACDLAEVLGMAIGLNLVFGIPLLAGITISVLDTFLLLFLLNFGIRKMEAFIISLVSIIGLSFLFEMIFAQPEPALVVQGLIPSLPDETALYIAIGIIGATVMPHNLYLHSALVQTRKFNKSKEDTKRAIKFNFIDSAIALNLAFFVNSAILILAASAFFKNNMFDVAEIQDAHRFLEPMLGTKWAPLLFGIALIAAGQSSTITGTLAGQIIMEGYLNLRIQPWLRRLITRLIAIVPAFLTVYYFGENATGKLLILSQVILSLQLGFAIIPLIHFVSDKKKMGDFAIGFWIKVLAWISASIIVILNIRLVYAQILEWLSQSEDTTILWFTVIPLVLGAGALLLYISFAPLFGKKAVGNSVLPHAVNQKLDLSKIKSYKRIAVAVDFSSMDSKTIQHALQQGGTEAQYMLVHIVETAGALVMGKEIKDFETESDNLQLNLYVSQLKNQNVNVFSVLGYGSPKKSIPEAVIKFEADLIVMGAHGHNTIKDLIFGTTVEAVRHKINIPILVVR